MEQVDLYQEIEQKRRELNASVRMLRKTGTELAEAERAYKVKLREHVLRLKADGMAVGLISLTIYGIKEVADLRFERDRAQYIYDANKDAVNSTKLQLRLLDNQLQREWSTPQAAM